MSIDAHIEHIIKEVSDVLGVSREKILNYGRQQHVVDARWFVWYALYLRGYTVTQIGDAFGRHHTGVSHALREIRARYQVNDRRTKKITAQLWHILDHDLQKYQYQVELKGNVIVTSSTELSGHSIRERALAEVDRGVVDLKTDTTAREVLEAA